MQALKVAAVPMHVNNMDKYVLVDTDAYNKLLDQTTHGCTWIMDDLRTRCGDKSIKWIKENILENPKYSRQIGRMEQQGQIIHKGRGSAWKFKASVMADFLESHWEELPW
ncbi:DUF771 domain-containing protein [Lactiplantibacillus plantarum]|uniref:DUF771 domain-containing protein n=1 Tax=Lactiplantibacillus plantarum TaxID=1590 RepID=UPI0032E0180E